MSETDVTLRQALNAFQTSESTPSLSHGDVFRMEYLTGERFQLEADPDQDKLRFRCLADDPDIKFATLSKTLFTSLQESETGIRRVE